MDPKTSDGGTIQGTSGFIPKFATPTPPKRKIDYDPRPQRSQDNLLTSTTDHGDSHAKRRLLFNCQPPENHLSKPETFYTTSKLNSEQSRAHRSVMAALKDRIKAPMQTRMFFLEGPSGSGKSHVAMTIFYDAMSKGFKVVTSHKVVASTSIAATLLPNGLTTYKQFGLGASHRSNIDEKSVHAEQLQRADLIIWDEVSSSLARHVSAADDLMRRLTSINVPFGAKVVLFSGDFRQSVPIMRLATPDEVIRNSLFSYSHWSVIQALPLYRNMRVDKPDFAEFLLEIALAGIDRKSGSTATPFAIIDTDMFVDSFPELVKATFGECLRERYPDTLGRAILTLTNAKSLDLNDRILSYLQPGERVVCIDGRIDTNDSFVDFFGTPPSSEDPPAILKLKKGASIILLCNDESTGLANGTFLTVDEITSQCLNCTIRTGPMAGEKAKIRKKKYRSIRQFPVRLSYSMTVNKAYGLNFYKTGLFLDSAVFTHGQLYTALSRVRRKEDVKLYLDPGCSFTDTVVKIKDKIAIKNIVWGEVYNHLWVKSYNNFSS